MSVLYLRRKVAFSAGHAYWLPKKSDEENRRLFGQWASRWGHGHNYIVEATIAGDLDETTGMVVNITDVDKVLKEYVTGPLADKHLNYDVPHFADTPPTLENIARYVAERFAANFSTSNARLTRVTVWESPTLWATLDLDRNPKNTMIALTRSFDFAAAHRLHAPGLSESENIAIFGKCNNPRGHGHNYGVEVTVIGEPDTVTGMIIDLAALDIALDREVMARFDHKHLNDDTPDFADVNPTSENLTRVIWNHLEKQIPAPARLYKVVVKETDRNYFEYYGENGGPWNDR
jgi:6-pyruvoyltetrahydropterin/6-carboxytetrahydropterin synthase